MTKEYGNQQLREDLQSMGIPSSSGGGFRLIPGMVVLMMDIHGNTEPGIFIDYGDEAYAVAILDGNNQGCIRELPARQYTLTQVPNRWGLEGLKVVLADDSKRAGRSLGDAFREAAKTSVSPHDPPDWFRRMCAMIGPFHTLRLFEAAVIRHHDFTMARFFLRTCSEDWGQCSPREDILESVAAITAYFEEPPHIASTELLAVRNLWNQFMADHIH